MHEDVLGESTKPFPSKIFPDKPLAKSQTSSSSADLSTMVNKVRRHTEHAQVEASPTSSSSDSGVRNVLHTSATKTEGEERKLQVEASHGTLNTPKKSALKKTVSSSKRVLFEDESKLIQESKFEKESRIEEDVKIFKAKNQNEFEKCFASDFKKLSDRDDLGLENNGELYKKLIHQILGENRADLYANLEEADRNRQAQEKLEAGRPESIPPTGEMRAKLRGSTEPEEISRLISKVKSKSKSNPVRRKLGAGQAEERKSEKAIEDSINLIVEDVTKKISNWKGEKGFWKNKWTAQEVKDLARKELLNQFENELKPRISYFLYVDLSMNDLNR